MVTAKFGSKKFEVSPKKIYTPDGVSLSESLDIEETERSGAKPSTSIKGIKLQSLSFDIKLDARFVSVYSEIQSWRSILRAKKPYDFTLGKYNIGKFHLSQFGASDIVMNRNGEYIKATLSLSFTEYAATTVAQKSESVTSVKESAKTKSEKKFRVGSVVEPIPNTKWYFSSTNCKNKSGKCANATVARYSILAVKDDVARVKDDCWMRPEDFKVISY